MSYYQYVEVDRLGRSGIRYYYGLSLLHPWNRRYRYLLHTRFRSAARTRERIFRMGSRAVYYAWVREVESQLRRWAVRHNFNRRIGLRDNLMREYIRRWREAREDRMRNPPYRLMRPRRSFIYHPRW